MSLFHRIASLLFFPLLLSAIGVVQAHARGQRVHYRMSIDLNTEDHSYTGRQQLTYFNGSPDTIREVYYHLFYNAFKPGSRMDRLDQGGNRNGWKRIGSLPPDQQGDVGILSLDQDGTEVEWQMDETVLRVPLARPLLPGDSTVLRMEWRTVIPRVRRRGGWWSPEGVEYSMSQWYPKLAEYDEHGWHPDDYVDREFYGVFGTFDVEITLPATYVVGGTGRVMNPNEVGCGYQFADRDTILHFPASGTGRKTWKFRAENVHDFAWVADRQYIHEITRTSKGIPVHLLYKRDIPASGRYSGWQDAAWWTAEILDYFSERFGEYAWPVFTVAQAGDGGMEYPMLIMITGRRGRSSLFGVIAHEIGHQWYYGMMANNETQEAWLDEGLTQYLTDEADRAINGDNTENGYTGLDRVVYPWDASRWRDIYSYYQLAVTGYDEPLDIFHDHFREDYTSSLVYYKGEAVARQLQYMLGDSLFDAGMRRYYETWKFDHPTARDFERAMEEASGMRMDLFFNQWVNTDKTCDYAFDDVRSEQRPEGDWSTTVSLSNRDEIFMPLDLVLTYEDGTAATANVPMEEWKKPGADFHLPPWFWGDRNYTVTFVTPKRVVRGEIDPSGALLDLDRTNNVASAGFLGNTFPPSHVAFYRRWDMSRPHDRYSIRLRPTLWYTEADGIRPGFVADGGYSFDRYNATLGLYYNVRSGRTDYRAQYETPVDFIGRLGRISLLGTNVDGIRHWRAELKKDLRPFYFRTDALHILRLSADHTRLLGGNYPNAVAPWDSGSWNMLGMGYTLETGSEWDRNRLSLDLDFDASFGSRTAFTQWKLRGNWRTRLGRLGLHSSLFAGTSLGQPPAQRLFNAAGASSASMHANPVHRLFMNAAPDFAARNRLLLPTEGRLVSLADLPDSVRFGRHLLNLHLELSGLNPLSIIAFPPFNRIDVRPYAAGGWIFRDKVTFAGFEDYVLEAGVTASVDVLRLLLPAAIRDGLDSPAPVVLSFTAPLWTGSPLLPDTDWKYRWGIGVSL